jgi:serine protease DegQ
MALKIARFKTMFRVISFVLQSVTLGLAIAFVFTKLWPNLFLSSLYQQTQSEPTTTQGPASYRDAVARAAPMVVNVYTRKIVTDYAYRLLADPRTNRSYYVPYAPLRQHAERSDGAGVIVSDDGYVLTNYHVIADAQMIYLGMFDGNVTSAKVIGVDQDTDLAVLKIEGTHLPHAIFANSTTGLAVGDVVLAIGNPVGLGQTVTLGIVSATGRDQPNLSRFEDFIQTDAAINLGNSGGALINAKGELVGINTGAFGRERGIQGVSFAIPALAAKAIVEEIIKHGYVIRGWMGAEYENTSLQSKEDHGISARGVRIVTVAPGGPAALAGLQSEDIVLQFADKTIEDEGDLRNHEAETKPNSVVVIQGLRAGVPFKVNVTLIERPSPQQQKLN